MNAGLYGVVQSFSVSGYDLSTVTSLSLKVVRPDGSSVTHGAEAVGVAQPPSLSRIDWTIAQGDLPTFGMYTVEITDTTTARNVPLMVVQLWVNPTL